MIDNKTLKDPDVDIKVVATLAGGEKGNFRRPTLGMVK